MSLSRPSALPANHKLRRIFRVVWFVYGLLIVGVAAFLLQSVAVNAFAQAARTGDDATVARMTRLGFPPDTSADRPGGTTPLMEAVCAGQETTAELLIRRGADVNHIENDENKSFTPLTFAAKTGELEIVKILVAHGADTRFRDQNGHDARYLAEFNGHKEVARYLKHLPQ